MNKLKCHLVRIVLAMITDCSGGGKNSVKRKVVENVFCLTRIQGEATSRVVKESHQITQLLDASGLELEFSNIFSILSSNIVNVFSRKTFIREIKSEKI